MCILQLLHHRHLFLFKFAHFLLEFNGLLPRLIHLRLVLKRSLIEETALRCLSQCSRLHDMVFVDRKIPAFLFKGHLFGFTDGLSDTYPLLFDFLARYVILHKLLLQVLLNRLLIHLSILLKPPPVQLLLLLQLQLMLQFDIKLSLFLVFHVEHELLLFARITDPLVHFLFVHGKLVQARLKPHHL